MTATAHIRAGGLVSMPVATRLNRLIAYECSHISPIARTKDRPRCRTSGVSYGAALGNVNRTPGAALPAPYRTTWGIVGMCKSHNRMHRNGAKSPKHDNQYKEIHIYYHLVIKTSLCNACGTINPHREIRSGRHTLPIERACLESASQLNAAKTRNNYITRRKTR